jgi:DNA replication protein DnaC
MGSSSKEVVLNLLNRNQDQTPAPSIDLVALDELGYLPFSKNGSQLLFHLISKLYEQTSVIITTNLLCGAPHNKFNAEFIVMRSPLSAGPASVSY